MSRSLASLTPGLCISGRILGGGGGAFKSLCIFIARHCASEAKMCRLCIRERKVGCGLAESGDVYYGYCTARAAVQ